jgi:hypothetical protein
VGHRNNTPKPAGAPGRFARKAVNANNVAIGKPYIPSATDFGCITYAVAIHKKDIPTSPDVSSKYFVSNQRL